MLCYKYSMFANVVARYSFLHFVLEDVAVDWGRGHGATTPSHLGL
jgi:hypothetical protein